MTDRAGHRLPGTAIPDERLAFFDAAWRHIRDEARMRIALRDSRLILRQRNDAISDRFHSPSRLRKSHASAANECFRDHAGFDYLRPNVWLERRKPLAGLLDFIVR